jgi:hypothetical protein
VIERAVKRRMKWGNGEASDEFWADAERCYQLLVLQHQSKPIAIDCCCWYRSERFQCLQRKSHGAAPLAAAAAAAPLVVRC